MYYLKHKIILAQQDYDGGVHWTNTRGQIFIISAVTYDLTTIYTSPDAFLDENDNPTVESLTVFF